MLTPIKVIQNQQIGPAVSGRELYGLITESNSIRDTFTDRFRHNQKKLGLVVGQDFTEAAVPLPGMSSNKRYFDAIIRLEAAKKIASIQTKKRGAGVLAYLEAYELNPAIADTTKAHQPNPLPAVSTQSEAMPGVSDQPSDSKGYQFEGSSIEVTAEPPKSRSQQLLEEAQKLQALAKEEAQREAEEAQQANQVSSEQAGTLPELLTMLDERINGVDRRFDGLEKKINTVLYFFQQASFAVRSLGPVSLPVESIGEPTPAVESTPEPTPTTEPTTRNLLVRLVNSFAAADRKTEHETWKYLYGQFSLRTGFNVNDHPAKGERNGLNIVEQHGKIEELYALAKRLFTVSALK